jgi:DNA topoisomerase VI subunit B
MAQRTHLLDRQTFVMSRAMEFFTEPELTKRIGQPREQWGVALVSELVANALDACEKAAAQTGRPAQVEVALGDDCLTVRDNGPGIPEDTIKDACDYTVRVSDNLYVVSPTRGQLGNALKCVIAAPFVADPSRGWVEFEVRGKLHRVDVTLDQIRGVPQLDLTHPPGDFVEVGTLVRLPACLLPPAESGDLYKAGDADEEDAEEDDQDDDAGHDRDRTLSWLLRAYATFNPHAAFLLVTPEGRDRFKVGNPTWSKWTPSRPTDIHWYTEEQFRDLVGAFINGEQSGGSKLSVREFVAKFHGMRAPPVQSRVVKRAGLDRGTRLNQLAEDDQTLDADAIDRLRRAILSATTQPVKSKALGVVGKGHLTRCLEEHYGVAPDSVRYKKVEGKEIGQPFVLEVAFGVCEDDDRPREVVTGINWSPVLKVPFPELMWRLGNADVDSWDPVVVLVHLAIPRPVFTDPGKSQLQLTAEMRLALSNCVRKVTAAWTREKRQADKNDRLDEQQLERQRRGEDKEKKGKLKAAARRFTPAAYDEASGSGSGPALARQIAYANRRLVLNSGQPKYYEDLRTYSQTILTEYMRDHPKRTKGWNVVFDARGHLEEPHTDNPPVPLGTLEVRDHVGEWTGDEIAGVEIDLRDKYMVPTIGPTNRYKAALFIEKEGFEPHIEAARIRERFDIAVFSTKGMSNTAARELAERLAEQGIPILVLTDFDKSGFGICYYLNHDSDRYKFKTRPTVTHIGLRLRDVRRLMEQEEWSEDDLSETVEYDCEKDPKIILGEWGATEEECKFLVREKKPGGGEEPGGGWKGKRVELNALPTPILIRFIEDKLRENGVEKVVPDQKMLEDAVKRAFILHRLEQAIPKLREEANNLVIPENLLRRVEERIEGTDDPWDQAVREIAGELDRTIRKVGRSKV